MFKKNKTNYKAKLEHKLYLARENPEPIFDLSDCGLGHVPSGIYSLCRVFLKESLLLDHNKLTSLSHGGSLKDLCAIKILNLEYNLLTSIPDDISYLANLKELYLSNNCLKKLSPAIGSLINLIFLDVSNNSLQILPPEIGNLKKLKSLYATCNKNLKKLPQSLCQARQLTCIQIDAANFIYPGKEVVEMGTEAIMKCLSRDAGVEYVPPSQDETEALDTSDAPTVTIPDDKLQEKIWEFEKLKEQKMQAILQFEKEFQQYQEQELQLHTTSKTNKQKFLTDLTHQQNKIENELLKLQHEKDIEKSRLLQELQEEEIQSDLAINKLLALNKEPLTQILEQERLEEERMLSVALHYNDTLRRNDVLSAMQIMIELETQNFNRYHHDREETTKSVLTQEMLSNTHLMSVLKVQGFQQAELISQLQKDMELQRAAVGALLERGDARSWSLVQQVHLVEMQLAKLTAIEMDRRKLELDEHVNELAVKRIHLSELLLNLLNQQDLRRTELLCTLHTMEEMSKTHKDFWLRQYQQLLDRHPTNFKDIQRFIDPEFAQELLLAGVIHCLPFLAKWAQGENNESELTDEELLKAGIESSEDRRQLMNAYIQYKKLKYTGPKVAEPSAPSASTKPEASVPTLTSQHSMTVNTECVICMDAVCNTILLPCGHMCCCTNCSSPLTDCPLCRNTVERKIKIITP